MATLKEWNFTLNDTSPLFQYYPPVLSDGSSNSSGWQIGYDDNISYHRTSASGANVSLSFFGTGITLFGTSDISYVAYFDDQEQEQLKESSDENVLFHSDGAANDKHTVRLVVHTAGEQGEIRLSSATVTSSVVGMQRTPSVQTLRSDGRRMKALGSWHTKTSSNHFPLDANSDTEVRATFSPGDILSFSFRGRAFAIYGPVNASSGLFSVSHSDDDHHNVNIVNASSPIEVKETVLYYEDGLDETNTTTISLTNLGDGHTWFCISRAEVFSFNSTNDTSSDWASSTMSSKERSMHIKEIVGPVIGIIVVVTTICGILMMRARKKRRIKNGGTASSEATITPFKVDSEATDCVTIQKSSMDVLPERRMLERTTLPQDSTGVVSVTRPVVHSLSLSTIERLLFISRQLSTVGRFRAETASLPPYPASERGKSFRSVA